jgi:U4/U6.U5 tri-snRNP-associated protein 2
MEKDEKMLNQKRERDDESNSKYLNEIQQKHTKTANCPYLGTIKRHLLDFDFEKLCSITLSNINVYACLCCGKYYQGRGNSTEAYTHSLEYDHHLFINLNDQRIFCIPDGYEVIHNSLSDIKFNLKPVFTKEDLLKIDSTDKTFKALDGTEYVPGCIGLNNIKKTDYVNVFVQSLCRITPLRNYFLQYEDNSADLVI